MSDSNYILNVLSGLFSSKIQKLRGRIRSKFFSEPAQIQLYAFCVEFYSKTKTIPTFEVVKDAFKEKLWDVQKDVELLIANLNPNIDDALFEYSLNKFIEEYKISLVDKLPRKINNITTLGLKKTLEEIKHTVRSVDEVENSKFNMYISSNEEDVNKFIETTLSDEIDNAVKVKVRNPIVNRITSGMQSKKLWIIGGAPGEMKSTQLLNWAYDAVISGMNIFYCTVEMDYHQVLRLFTAIHVYRRFNYILDVKSIEDKKLTNEEKEYFKRGHEEFKEFNNNLIVFELPQRYSFSNLESKLIELNDHKKIDGVFIDYLLLLKPDEKRIQRHEEDEALFKQAKELAMTFDNGRGIFVATAHQVNVEGIKKARKRGQYVMEDLAKTAEARNSPDFIVVNFYDNNLREQLELKQNVLKNRGGPIPTDSWTCPVQPECGVINPPLDSDDIPKDLKL